jgi:hypothetical protein
VTAKEDPAIIEAVKRKLQEARDFFDRMRDQEQRAFGDKRPFDQYLSAFLNAGMSVRGAFHAEQDRQCNEALRAWKKVWETKLTQEQMRIYEFMHEDRIREVHKRGSRRIVEEKNIKVGTGGSYSDKSGTLVVMGSPSVLTGVNTWATISMPRYVFEIGGVKRLVTDVCAEYLTLLEQMFADYKVNASS